MACTGLRRRRMSASAHPARQPYIRGARGRTRDLARPYRTYAFRATVERGDIPCRGLRRRRTPAHPMACTALRRRRMPASAYPVRDPYIRGPRGRTRDLARPYRTYAFRATVERGDIPCRGLRRRRTPAHPMACTALRRRRMPASAYPVRDPYIRGPRGRTRDLARPYRTYAFRATVERGDIPCRGLRRRRRPEAGVSGFGFRVSSSGILDVVGRHANFAAPERPHWPISRFFPAAAPSLPRGQAVRPAWPLLPRNSR